MAIFDGKAFARERDDILCDRVSKLKDHSIIPKLVSIVVGNADGALKYQKMKKSAAERVGAVLDIKTFDDGVDVDEIVGLVEVLNNDQNVHGVMLQLPLPDNYSSSDRDRIIGAIKPEKDVDGMLPNSPFVTPVVKAALEILEISDRTRVRPLHDKIAVVGAAGFVGGRVVEELAKRQRVVIGLDVKDNLSAALPQADVVISTTGKPGLITKDLVKEGVVLIDVGAPKGDIENTSYGKASFVSPVPGGVGPVTISCLVENLVSSSESRLYNQS